VNIILLGPPGAGKGTQANNLVKDCKLYKISTGDLLREEIRNSTVLGNKIKSIIDKGLLVTDDIINDLIKKALSNKKINNRLIFDGYPRNLDQAKELDLLVKKNNQKISCALSLEVDKESIIKRILGRQICSKCGLIFNEYFSPATVENHNCDIKFLYKRSDDNEKTIRNRFQTYQDMTLPILNFYRGKELLRQINGMAKIDDISKEIRGIITSIET
jgi:adenylate kinase